MASDWRETYKKLKKRKEAIDKATNEKELNKAKQSYGRTGQSLYTGKAIGALNSNQTPTKKVTTTTKKKKDNDRLFSAFDDGYDIGDVTKTILKVGKRAGETAWETGKKIGTGLVTDPIQTIKTGLVSTAEGIDNTVNTINEAGNDFFDWLLKREDDGKIKLDITEQARLSYASDEEKQAVLEQYAKDYGTDSEEYKRILEFVNLKVNKSPTAIENILNPKYFLTDTYKAKQEGTLSEEQQEIYGMGQQIGEMLPSVGLGMINPVLGSGSFYVKAQQNYTDEAKARGYSDKDARTYGLIMGGAETLVERLGFDELGGLNKLSKGNILKNMAGEGLEEFIMPYIDSTVKSVGYGEEFDLEGSTEEAIEGGVMGAFTSLIMSSGGKGLKAVDNFVNKVNTGQEITQEDFVNAGVELQEADPNTVAAAMTSVPQVVQQEIQKAQEQQNISNETIIENNGNIVQDTNDNVEMVSTEKLSRYREFDRLGKDKILSDEEIAKLRQDIKENGITSPINILYNPETGQAYIDEGNTRLAIAIEEGLKEVPTIVTRTTDSSRFEGKKTIYLKKGLGEGKTVKPSAITSEFIKEIEQQETPMNTVEETRTTPSQEELDNLEDTRQNKSGSEYADAFYSLEKKYGKANLYKGLNSYKTTGKALEIEQNTDGTIKDVSTGYSDGEHYHELQYNQDGKVVGILQYGEYEGEPNVKMIEVAKEYRRKGIGTKLLQELQNKYPDVEIDFGMSTPDGTKLLEKATYTVENKEVADKLARIEEIQKKLEEYDKGYENYFENDLPIPENYAEDYNSLDDELRQLQEETRGKKATKTFVRQDNKVKDTTKNVQTEQKEITEQVQEAIAPLQETIEELNEKITTLQENIAPIQEKPKSFDDVLNESVYYRRVESNFDTLRKYNNEFEKYYVLKDGSIVALDKNGTYSVIIDNKFMIDGEKFKKGTNNIINIKTDNYSTETTNLNLKDFKNISELENDYQEAKQENVKTLSDRMKNNIAPIEGYTEEDISLSNQKNMESLEAQNIAPIEDTSPDVTPTNEAVTDPFENRDIKEVGNRKVNAYMYENPEVKPFFQQAATEMLGDLQNSIKGEKVWLQELNQDTGLYQESMVTGTKRLTTDDIAELLDVYHYTYAQIEKGLNAIIEDNGKENNAVSKRIEFMLNDRLLNGYKSVDGFPIPPNQEYRALIQDKNIQEYTEQAYAEWNKNINQDELAPSDIEYVSNSIPKAENVRLEDDIAPTDVDIPKIQNEPRIENIMFADPTESLKRQAGQQIAEEMRYTKTSSKVTKTKKQMFGDAWGKLREQFFNSFHYVDKYARDTGNQQIKYNTDMYNNVYAEINGELTTAQTDSYGNPIGEALLAPFEEAKANGEYEQLNDYLMHYSNIDRHHVGKGSVVPLEYSRKMIAEYDKSNPKLKEYAKRVWRGYKNDLANMQANGLISGQFNMTLQKMYPHYNPFMFEQEFKPSMEDDGIVRPKKVIKKAEGGAFEILEMEEARVRYTQSVRSAIRKNDVLKEIAKTSDKTAIGLDVRIDPTDINQGFSMDEKGNYYATAYVDGIPQQAKITEDMYRELMQEGKQKLRTLEDKYALITKPLQAAGKLRRNLLTTWSPTFMITNPVKDIQDASFNSKYTKDFAKYYPTAAIELGLGKTDLAKQFLTLYGIENTYGDYTETSKATKNGKFVNKLVNAVPNFNNLVELAPRFAEFKASLDNGANIQEAMYNAREVTVNFGRGGYVAKALNRNGFTFLNASLQGFDKLARNFSGENGAKGVVGALSKVAILGVAPALFNALAFGVGDDEDEDYKALPDYIKDNYYIIKTSDGEFIRIPKGRMLSIFGSAARRTLELTQGEKDAFEGYLTNAYSQVGVQNPLESNIFAPIMQAANNKTWYGTDLVPTRLQDKPTEEQYDETTDEFSKWLGQQMGISPYKINYVLDQYSGGIGDLILPTITEEATSDGSFLAPIKDKFTANTTFDNKYVSDFYGTKEKLEVKANGSRATEEDILKSKYMTSVSYEMSELYKEKREVQSNSDLTKAEKFERVQEIQKQINSLAEEGLNNYENIHKTSTYAQVGDKEFYKDANNEWRIPYDDELEELNSLGMDIDDKSSYFEAKNKIYEINEKYRGSEDTYEDRKKDIIEVVRYSNLNTDYKSYLYGKYYSEDTTNIVNMLGINFDAYLDYETQYFVADKDEAGKSISGSKKKKVFDYINSMDIGFEEKVILAKLEYPSYDEYNHEIINYLNNSDITYDEMVFILKQMEFEVTNDGNIYWK